MLNKLSAFWSRLTDSSLCELIELLGSNIPLPKEDPKKRDRVFNQWRTFWLFLGQILSVTQSCSETLKKAQGWLYLARAEEEEKPNEKANKKKSLIQYVNTSAYCQARARLEQDYLDQIDREVVEKGLSQVKTNSKFLWCGRHVKVVDGSSLSMPDTKGNQLLYPQPKNQKKGCGFPVMRFAASFSLITGNMLEHRKANLHVHERTLWHQMWESYEENDVVLSDRGFCSYCDFWALSQKKVDSVTRLSLSPNEPRKNQKLSKNLTKMIVWLNGQNQVNVQNG